MKYIGRWMRSLHEHGYPLPHELVGAYEPGQRRAVLEHLRTGRVCWEYRGNTRCLFNCGFSVPYAVLADGRWAWPSDLAHYVESHSVLIPPEFIADAASSTGIPEFRESWRSEADDLGLWLSWCSANASGCLKSRIASALEEADREADRVLAAEVSRLEQAHGVSSVPCLWAGCTSQALNGMVLCGRCCLKGKENQYVMQFFDVSMALHGEPGVGADSR